MDLDTDSDPDSAIFIIELQDTNKKQFFLISFSAYYFSKKHLHNFSRIKKSKRSHKTVGIKVTIFA
jgi:hypothetical protein